MTRLQQITFNNLKEMLIAGELLLVDLVKASEGVKSPQHKWEHGDIFTNKSGFTMICIEQLKVHHPKYPIQVFCLLGACDCTHNASDYLPDGKFLFNIKEKL